MFDRFSGVRDMHDALHENARRDDLVGVDLARLDEMLDLGDRHLAGGRHHRIEIPRRLAIDEIAFGIGLPGMDERDDRR